MTNSETETQTPKVSQELPLLTFNSLYNLRREEKRNSSLQKLPDQFYEAVKKFMDDKKKEILRLKNDPDKTKLRKEHLVLKNSKKILSELISIRGSKVAKVAIQNVLNGEETLDKKSVLEKEEKLYAAVQKSINTLKKEIL